MPARSTVLLAVTISALAVLAGCGDTDPPAAAVAGCEGRGRTVVVEVPEFSFDPDPVAVGACDEVVWRNAHDQAHTSTGDGDQSWGTGTIDPGEQSEPVRFERAGAFTYLCSFHPFMTGTVQVS